MRSSQHFQMCMLLRISLTSFFASLKKCLLKCPLFDSVGCWWLKALQNGITRLAEFVKSSINAYYWECSEFWMPDHDWIWRDLAKFDFFIAFLNGARSNNLEPSDHDFYKLPFYIFSASWMSLAYKVFPFLTIFYKINQKLFKYYSRL